MEMPIVRTGFYRRIEVQEDEKKSGRPEDVPDRIPAPDSGAVRHERLFRKANGLPVRCRAKALQVHC